MLLLSTRSLADGLPHCGGSPQQRGSLLFSLFAFGGLFRCILVSLVHVNHTDHPTKNLHSAALQNPIQYRQRPSTHLSPEMLK